MRDRDSTVRGRELGSGLRVALEKSEYDSKRIADKLGWSETKVSNLLSGRRGASQNDVAAFLALCGVKGAKREALLQICGEAKERGWWLRYGPRLPQRLRTLIDHENAATSISNYEPVLIPGLLQIPDYTRAMLKALANIPELEIEDRVMARAGRQGIFSREKPPHFTFYINELALMRTGPGPEIMLAQLRHLLRMSARSCITLRVVPDAGGFDASPAGSFVFMEFEHIKPVIHIECETSSLFVEGDEEVQAYRNVLNKLAETALGEEESRELIAQWATRLE